MHSKAYTFQLPEKIMQQAKSFCKTHGMSVTFFVAKSISERLETISDIKEFDWLFPERESAVDLDMFLKELS